MATTKYVCGFAFDGPRVLLIEKAKPAWQAGKMNGIGGKIEETDHCPACAMAREFNEETGLVLAAAQWEKFAILSGPGFKVHFFRTWGAKIDQAKSMTDEPVRVVPVEEAGYGVPAITNLRRLIPFALHEHTLEPIHIRERDPVECR